MHVLGLNRGVPAQHGPRLVPRQKRHLRDAQAYAEKLSGCAMAKVVKVLVLDAQGSAGAGEGCRHAAGVIGEQEPGLALFDDGLHDGPGI